MCHAHSDRKRVDLLYSRLTKDGVDAWMDKEKLLPGQDWEFEIRKAVRAADVVIICLSKQFNQAGFRQKEVRLALNEADQKPEGEIFIIPARLEECENLENLKRWHWVDLFTHEGYEILMRTLITRAEEVNASTPFSEDKFTSKYSKSISALSLRQSLILMVDVYNVIYKTIIPVNCPSDIHLDLWSKHKLLEIVREALQNAIFHTGFYNNRSVEISIDVTTSNHGRDLKLCVSDTGPGFDFERVKKSGIIRMKDLAASLNVNSVSDLQVLSLPNKGTKVVMLMKFK